MFTCVAEKSKELDNISKEVKKMKDISDVFLLQKQFYNTKFECFSKIKSPSSELITLFQCYKNYYEAKFDTTVTVPSL